MSEESIISLKNVNKWFGDFHVLQDVNLEVKKKERIVVCGPSGSGKSTMIRCINRLEEHQEGSIVVDGIELTGNLKNIDNVRKEVGMVFQQFNLFPHLSVKENITLAPIWVKKMPKAEAEELAMRQLEIVKIPEQANKYPGQLSGGQQQRVAIEMIKEVLDVMVDLANGGMTMIVVTHEMGFAKTVADRMVFMDEGKIVEEASPDKFFNNPESDRTKLFLSQILHQ